MRLDSRKLDDCVSAMDSVVRRSRRDDGFRLGRHDDEWSEEAREAAARARRTNAGPSPHREAQPHPFVHAFAREHNTLGKQKAYLKTVPVEKLHTALKLIGQSGDRGAMSNSVKGLIESELGARGKKADWSPMANQVVKSTATEPHRGMNELP